MHTKEDFKINLESYFVHKLKFKNLIIKPIAGRLFKIEISSSSSENNINNLNQVIEFIISGDKDKFNTEAATLKFRINDLENEINILTHKWYTLE